MERSLNRVELKGNVGFDPKVTQLDEGNQVVRFSMATNERYKNRSGEWVDETVWHNVVAWTGKGITDFSGIKKGSLISVVGRLKPVKYSTKDGVEKYSYEVLAFSLNLISKSATNSSNEAESLI